MGTLMAILDTIGRGVKGTKNLVKRGLNANQVMNDPSLLGKMFIDKVKSIIFTILKGFALNILLVVLILSVVIGGCSLFMQAFLEDNEIDGNFTDNLSMWASKLSDAEVKKMMKQGSTVNPKNLPVYISAEKKTIPSTVSTKQKRYTSIYEGGKTRTQEDYINYNLNLSKTAFPYRLAWQFLVGLDAINDSAHKAKEVNKKLIRDAELQLAPIFTWAYNKYTKDVTDSEQIWELKYGPNGKLISKKLVKETHVTNSYPLPYLDAVSTLFKDYTFLYKLDQVTKDEKWSDPVELNRRTTSEYTIVTERQTKQKIVEDILTGTEHQTNSRLKDFFKSHKLNWIDLEVIYQIVASLPQGRDIAEEIAEVIEDDGGTFSSGGMEGFDDENFIEGNGTRDDLLKNAMSLLELPYFWGGKYEGLGRNPDWGKPRVVKTPGSWATNGPAIPYGMDCSGYVSWVYNQVLLQQGQKRFITGTSNQIAKTTAISEKDLKPGDLGFYALGGNNHVGIYIGEINGYKAFIHDGGKAWKGPGLPAGRVVITYNNTTQFYKGNVPSKFKYFRRVNMTFKDDVGFISGSSSGSGLKGTNIVDAQLRYKDINKDKMLSFLNKRNSYFADTKYIEVFVRVGKQKDINPYLLIAITGQEQGFVKRSHPDAAKMANNPFNTFGSWKKAQPGLEKSAQYAADCIIKLSKNKPSGYHPLKWLCGKRNPAGFYAGDPNWWLGVGKFFSQFEKY